MIKLIQVVIHKYKSIETEQNFYVEPDTTVLVGMNESGKTSVLEALAKVNYFENDKAFKFDMTMDYPRKQKKRAERSGEVQDAVTLVYSIDENLANQIKEDVGVDFKEREFSITKKYDNNRSWNLKWIATNDFIPKNNRIGY